MDNRAEWPDGLPREPWEHQHAAYDRLGSLWFNGQKGTALFSDMGTGKSLVAIALWKAFGFRRVLIVSGTKAMVEDWPEMIAAETGGEFDGIPLLGTIESRAAFLRTQAPYLTKPYAIVTNVEAYHSGKLGYQIEKVPWDCVIFDESQRIKGAGSKMSLFAYRLAKLSDPYRLCMTGTPLHDKPVDIYGQYRFADARIFGTNFESFLARYTVRRMVDEHVYVIKEYINQAEFAAKVNSISFSVDDSVLDLPPIHEFARNFSLSPKARKLYDDLDALDVLDFGAQGTVIAGNTLTKGMRLQQLTSGFVSTVDDDEETGIVVIADDRQRALEELITVELNPAYPVVVFARFRYDLDRIREVAAKLGRGYFEQSGNRHQWRDFRAASSNEIIGVQIQAGGAGIDLTRAPYGIYYSHGFSYGDFRQSRKRIHRPGQKHPTVLFHIVMRRTVDVKIQRALREKRDVDVSILKAA